MHAVSVVALCADPQSQLLPGGHSFPSVAARVLGAEGLTAPSSCREVLRFDASTLAGTTFPAARVRHWLLLCFTHVVDLVQLGFTGEQKGFIWKASSC